MRPFLVVFAALVFAGCTDCPDNRDTLINQCPCGIDDKHPLKDANECTTFACIECEDMDMGVPDMSKTADCTAIGTCLYACTTPSCAQGCLDAADPFIGAAFNTSLKCGLQLCVLPGDGGDPRCVKSGEVYDDPAGAVAGTCKQCLAEVLAPLFGVACANQSNPDCMADSCHNARLACGVP